jgi:hypothetical protein
VIGSGALLLKPFMVDALEEAAAAAAKTSAPGGKPGP